MMSTPSYLYTFLFLLINYIRKNLLCYACFYSSTIRSVYVQRGQSWFFSWGRTTSGSLPRLTATEQIYSKVILQNYVIVTTLIFSFNNKQKFTLNMFSFSIRYNSGFSSIFVLPYNTFIFIHTLSILLF